MQGNPNIDELLKILDTHSSQLALQTAAKTGTLDTYHKQTFDDIFAPHRKRMGTQVAQVPAGVGGGNKSAMFQMGQSQADLLAQPQSQPQGLPVQQQPYVLQPAVDMTAQRKLFEEQDKARASKERLAEKARIRRMMDMK